MIMVNTASKHKVTVYLKADYKLQACWWQLECLQ